MRVFDRLRRNTLVRYTAQAVLVVVLLALTYVAASYEGDAERQEQTTQTVSAIVAATCNAASFEELKADRLLEECRLAQQGELGNAVEEEVAEEEPVIPAADPLPDDPATDPDDVQQAVSEERLAAAADDAVNRYFAANPLPGDEEYQAAIRRTVTTYLRTNPPPPGRPPTAGEIRVAVRNALVANPPDAGPPGLDGTDGVDGDDGVGVAQASLDGCDVVFTYSNGSTDRVGPLCGADGEPAPPPTDGQVAAQVAAYCDANGQCRGPTGLVNVVDDCPSAPAGRFLTDVTPVYDAETSTLRITCETAGVLTP